ncbi:MAG: PaaI family thioesterase [Acidimicrobiia bacterium]
MTIDLDHIRELRRRYDACFGCGLDNALGLQLDGFELADDGAVTAPFEPRAEYAGFEETLHGGIVATALDEISAWSAMLSHRVLVFTATLDLRYRAQARSTSVFTMRGLVEEKRGRRLKILGQMIDGDAVVAESRGLFVVAEDFTAALDSPNE